MDVSGGYRGHGHTYICAHAHISTRAHTLALLSSRSLPSLRFLGQPCEAPLPPQVVSVPDAQGYVWWGPSEWETQKSSVLGRDPVLGQVPVLGRDPVLGRSLGPGAESQRNKGLTTVQSSCNLRVVQLRSGMQGLAIGLMLETTAEQGGLGYSLCYKLRGYSPKRPNRNLRGQYFIQDNLLPTSPLVRHRILSLGK